LIPEIPKKDAASRSLVTINLSQTSALFLDPGVEDSSLAKPRFLSVGARPGG